MLTICLWPYCYIVGDQGSYCPSILLQLYYQNITHPLLTSLENHGPLSCILLEKADMRCILFAITLGNFWYLHKLVHYFCVCCCDYIYACWIYYVIPKHCVCWCQSSLPSISIVNEHWCIKTSHFVIDGSCVWMFVVHKCHTCRIVHMNVLLNIDDAIQKSLLAEGDKLSFSKAVSLAQPYETAVRDAMVLLPVEQHPVHKVQRRDSQKLIQPSQHSKKLCYWCGNTGHLPSACQFKSERCHFCKKIGHICKENRDSRIKTILTLQPPQTGQEYSLFTLSASMAAPILVSVYIDALQVDMELDTGSAISLVSENTNKKHSPDCQLQ